MYQREKQYSSIQKELLSLSFKSVILISLFVLSGLLMYGQKSGNKTDGNIKIIDSTVENIITGFNSYLLEKGEGEKFNASEYFVGITILSQNDSADHIEVTLSNYALTRSSVRVLPGFYGYFKRDGINFIFWNKNRFIKKNKSVSNPDIFKKFKKPGILRTDHPYSWEIVLKNGTILDMSPKETIQKYIIIQPHN
jgi:hypothetical protein